MSEAPDWMAPQALPTLRQGKNVLAVEGDDDKDVYKAWLQKLIARGTILSDTIVIVDAGSKDAVLEGLVWYTGEQRQNWGNFYGLVDRDEWDSSSIAARTREHPRLLVNSNRHCLESYFIKPSELEAALTAKDGAFYGARIRPLTTHLQLSRGDWVDHWSLWVTTCRISRRLSDELFPGFFNNLMPLPADSDVQARLTTWAGVVDPATVFEAFRLQRDHARGLSEAVQFRSCINAKRFFPQFVAQFLSDQSGRRPAKQWMLGLAKWMPEVPTDIASILSPLVRRQP